MDAFFRSLRSKSSGKLCQDSPVVVGKKEPPPTWKHSRTNRTRVQREQRHRSYSDVGGFRGNIRKLEGTPTKLPCPERKGSNIEGPFLHSSASETSSRAINEDKSPTHLTEQIDNGKVDIAKLLQEIDEQLSKFYRVDLTLPLETEYTHSFTTPSQTYQENEPQTLDGDEKKLTPTTKSKTSGFKLETPEEVTKPSAKGKRFLSGPLGSSSFDTSRVTQRGLETEYSSSFSLPWKILADEFTKENIPLSNRDEFKDIKLHRVAEPFSEYQVSYDHCKSLGDTSKSDFKNLEIPSVAVQSKAFDQSEKKSAKSNGPKRVPKRWKSRSKNDWHKDNPITLNKRYAGCRNLFRTPRSEYGEVFRYKKPVNKKE